MGNRRRRAVAVAATVAVAAGVLVATAFAGTGYPVQVSVAYNGATSTLTVSGQYYCNDVGDQGAAVFQKPNTPASTSPIDSLQKAAYGHTDNRFDMLDNCTAKGNKSFSLTYTNVSNPGDAEFCLVVYHRKSINNPPGVSGDNTTADGTYVNTDNSWQEAESGKPANSYAAGACASVAPALHLIKKVTNDNGGNATADQWTLTATGTGPSPTNLSGKTPVNSGAAFKAGTYTLAESGPTGYTGTWVCVDTGSANAVTVTNSQVTVGGAHQDVTCTIDNNDDPAHLTLVKEVKNDNGGSLTVADFPLFYGGTRAFSGVQNDVSGGVSYALSETNQPGYSASAWTCVGGTQNGASITLALGGSAVCTITNTSQPAHLTLVKIVDGGTKTVADFPLFYGGTLATSGVLNTVKAGTYALSETQLPGYTAGAWICEGGMQEGANITLAPGGSSICTIRNTRQVPSITVEKSVSDTVDGTYGASASRPENGGTFFFKLRITNTSAEDTISVTGLQDVVDGLGNVSVSNLTCPKAFPFAIAKGDSVTCTFTRDLIGNAGKTETDHVDVSWKDRENVAKGPTSSNNAVISLTDVKPSILVTKSANPTSVVDSGTVTFTAVVKNTSDVDPLTIDTLGDSIYGNLITGPTKATCTFNGQTVTLPGFTLQVGQFITCTFQAVVSQTETDVVSSSGHDDEQPSNSVTGSANATVTVTTTVTTTPPPTTPPYVAHADIAVTKAATAQVQLPKGGGSAPITYTLVVTNNGPDAAANVKVADAAPVDVTFVSATTSAGTCIVVTTAPTSLDCTISSLASGASVAITINATVNATGTKTNVVKVTTTTPETNTGNNTASAQTLVTARANPPRPPKPTKPPVVAPEICNTLTVAPKVVQGNGKAQKLRIMVTKGKKGVAGVTVRISGPGIAQTATSGKNGKVSVSFKPIQPGIIKVEVIGSKACNTQRIGVVGTYEPPVTG